MNSELDHWRERLAEVKASYPAKTVIGALINDERGWCRTLNWTRQIEAEGEWRILAALFVLFNPSWSLGTISFYEGGTSVLIGDMAIPAVSWTPWEPGE